MENKQTYTLLCDKCGVPYQSIKGFPSPQFCPQCMAENNKLLLTDDEIHHCYLYIKDPFIPRYLDTGRQNAQAQLSKILNVSRNPATDLENELADKEFARQYRDARIKTAWEIKMVEKLGYIPIGIHKAKIEEAKKQERLVVVEEIKELCIPLDLISNNKGIALTFSDLVRICPTGLEDFDEGTFRQD